MNSDGMVALRRDRWGILKLEALRPVALRAGRLAEALFGASEADVVVLQNGLVWRGKRPGQNHDDRAAAEIAMLGDDFYWVADTQQDASWRDQPRTQGPDAIRFCASAPIVVGSGVRLGALRVFDNRPRKLDRGLADRLKDLATFVADECDRLISHETWVMKELFEQAPGFMAVFEGLDHVFSMINPAFIALVGQRQLIGVPARHAIPEIVDQDFFGIMGEVFATGRPYVGQGAPLLLQRAPGEREQRFVDFVLQPITDNTGQVASILVQGNDVTREHTAVEALEASRAELEAALAASQVIFDTSLDVICTITRTGVFTKVSKSAKTVWGYSPDELVGTSFMDLVHPDDRDVTASTEGRIVAERRPTQSFRNRYIHKDGSVVPIAWSAVWSEQHNALICVARDMRDSVAAEEKLRQAQKMEALGRLTGGVAHDFNNLLTVIIGGAETLRDENADDPEVHDIAAMISAAGERGSELTSQLLAFARLQPLAPRSLQVDELLSGMGPLLRRTLGEDVDLRVARDPHAWRTIADPTQLELAVLNLAINARDAMPSGGKLTIETANVALDKAYSMDNDDLEVGDYLMIAVTDNGEGMSPETIAKAFEPFFTTKGVGKGTGLGLSMVHGFVKQSKGNIKMYSELGIGTTLKLYLPRASLDDSAKEPKREGVALARGEEHILLVEDDVLLREHATKQLASLGYRVSVAGNGPEALAMFDTIGDFDLLFTDIVMPGGMNGRQLADHMRLLKPKLRVLYTSGYTENAIVHHGRLDSGVDLLNKPYRKRELALKVRKVLNA